MNFGEIMIYQNEKGDTRVEVFLEGETIWLNRVGIAALYQTTPQNITMHIKNIYEEKELDENPTSKNSLLVQNEGSREVARNTKFYNLEMVLAVGYRVRSDVGIAFRKWASGVLSEYVQKGFAMNDERLKNPQKFGADYFDELLERIKDIRASERRFYQKITDIYAKCSADYDQNSDITQKFFAIVQNKLHFAITGHTAAEIIRTRADSGKDNMGLTTWKNAPKGSIRKSDVVVAKNYLSEEEISGLNRIVNMYLDYAEDQAQRRKAMYMKDWVDKLNSFLQFNERDILGDLGKISAAVAKSFAEGEYKKYQDTQDKIYESDFDRLVSQSKSGMLGKNNKNEGD